MEKYISKDNISFSDKELAKLREVLCISIGKHAEKLTNEDLIDIGSSMLQATAIVLRAKHKKVIT